MKYTILIDYYTLYCSMIIIISTYCILCLVIDNEAIALTVSLSSHRVASTALHDTVCASFFNTGQ